MVVMCWLVIHTSFDKYDNRKYEKVRGYVMHDTDTNNTVNFYESFKKKHIDMKFNPPVQLVNGNECLYVRK